MLMNRAETSLVNSPPRRWLQRFYEVPVLLRFGGRLIPGARAVEIGCGSGYGCRLILERFGAAAVDGVDLDPAMIGRAGRRLACYGDRVRLAQGSATDLRTALDADDDSYSAVFDFGMHPAWARPRSVGCPTAPQYRHTGGGVYGGVGGGAVSHRPGVPGARGPAHRREPSAPRWPGLVVLLIGMRATIRHRTSPLHR